MSNSYDEWKSYSGCRFCSRCLCSEKRKDSNMRAFFTCEISADMLLSFLWVQMFFVGEHAEREISERFREILRSKEKAVPEVLLKVLEAKRLIEKKGLIVQADKI